jgi:sterol desaturase/sphingolipid hydroxylase (fatty acid hydroxylase superfamily)
MMFEHRSEPLLSRKEFFRRLGRQGVYAGALVMFSVTLGLAGYHWIAGFSWIDAFLNTCMLLGGMGPVGDLPNNSAKVFAGVFALYSGLVFLLVAAFLLAPVFHRVLHHFHWEIGKRDSP